MKKNSISGAKIKRKLRSRDYYPGGGQRLIWFFVLILIYAVCNVYVLAVASRSDAIIRIMGQPIPLRAFTGGISNAANLCVIFLVVFYKKPGFTVSMIFLFLQFPFELKGLFIDHIYINIAGFFGNVLIIVAVILLYVFNNKANAYQYRLQKQAGTDQLTGLPNRFACSVWMNELVRGKKSFAIAVFNINNFRSIYNTMGQTATDGIIVEIAERLRKAAANDTSGAVVHIGRNSRDEFTFIVRGRETDEEIIGVLEKYRAVFRQKVTVDGCDYYLTARIGYAIYPQDADTADGLYTGALIAMTRAKQYFDKKYVCRYTAEIGGDKRDMETERKIRSALEHDRLYFRLQPQFDIQHNIRGFEALARIRDEDGAEISPADFIPVAEKSDLIDRIDFTVFKNAAAFLGGIMKKTGADLTLSVNVSVRHLMKNDFLNEVREILETSGVPAGKLEIEITESIMIDSVDKALESINKIKEMGLKIALDDFGTGYSSLSYLNNFPADIIKVDKSFIDKMNAGASHRQYVAAIISIGHTMDLDVIAEGVETEEQLSTLKSIGCDYIQGFCWGRPMLPVDAEKLVTDAQNR